MNTEKIVEDIRREYQYLRTVRGVWALTDHDLRDILSAAIAARDQQWIAARAAEQQP